MLPTRVTRRPAKLARARLAGARGSAWLVFAGVLLLHPPGLASEEDGWLRWFSRDLDHLDAQRWTTQQQLSLLGAPVIGQTAPQFGFQGARQDHAPAIPPWVQIDLGLSQEIDTIAVIPAVLDWQSDAKRTYGFPVRFHVDISDAADFTTATRVGDFTESDLPDPGIAPVVLQAGHARARYVRLTVIKLAEERGQFFFALGEMMVLSGNRNIAIGKAVTSSAAFTLAPRWTPENLVDGRTPLGPPIRIDLLPWDGFYAGPSPKEPFTSMRLDLGHDFPLQEIRLYAIHARIGADIPGYSLPERFRVEVARHQDFSDVETLLSGEVGNPGDNPITIDARNLTARYVRVALMPGDQGRFGLSEIEVYSNDHNVALGASVTATPDPYGFTQSWPSSVLVDGYSSFGRLMELPVWLERWHQRTTLVAELARLDHARVVLLANARVRAWWAVSGALLLVGMLAIAWLMALRSRRLRELENLRGGLARDLHDEIGSNLAAIARLSELAGADKQSAPPDQGKDDWQEINRIATESMDGLREVLWLAGARDEAGPDLAQHLTRLVDRLLGGCQVRWTSPVSQIPSTWPPLVRKELFLFVKEALTNIVRHAHAKQVDLGLAVRDGELHVEIVDHGRGFDPLRISGGLGLTSLRARAQALGGTLVITSSPGSGTQVHLRVPQKRLADATRRPGRTPA